MNIEGSEGLTDEIPFNKVLCNLEGVDRRMVAVVQRVKRSSVTVNGNRIASIGRGYNVLLGVCKGDSEEDARKLADKLVKLRVFEDDSGKMNLSIKDVGGEILVVSQFTLCADLSKGRRPSFTRAEDPQIAKKLIAEFVNRLSEHGIDVHVGEFGAYMLVEIVNDGPATFILTT